jgi:tetratricopeptide (TPR) repeat protein
MKRNTLLLIFTAVASFFGGALSNLNSQERFDHKVRGDFFAGFAGNEEALQRAMKLSLATLEKEPNHAEAMVWAGAGFFFQSGQFFSKGDMEKGGALYGKGIGMMKQAVVMEPNNIGVRIPRAATLMAGTQGMPPQMAKPLLEDAVSDYLAVYELQKNMLDKMGTHPRGELLFGLANGYSRIGNTEKAEFFFGEVRKQMPDSVYAKRAAKWFETKQPLPAAQAQCVGCHTGK